MKVLLSAVLFAAAVAARAGSDTVFRSGVQRVMLVELFTSEGCSSCPPAEKWLGDLRKQDGLWKQFVPVAFHVDYWDHLGWPDRFANHAFTERQNAYVRAWRTDTMYTPGIVVNGRAWRDWRSAELPVAGQTDKPGVLEVESRGGTNWVVTFTPTGTGPWQFHAALMGCGIDVEVKAGENAGRTLRHDFVVLAYTNGPLAATDHPSAEFSFGKPRETPEETAIAVWIARRNSSLPLQAVGGLVPASK